VSVYNGGPWGKEGRFLKMRFQTVSIFAETRKPGRTEMARRIVDRLASEGCEIRLSHDLQISLDQNKGEPNDWDRLLDADLLVCVGGDGTMLRVAREAAEAKTAPCVCGVNAGRLGFLTAVPDEGLEVFLGELMEGRYTIQYRSLLRVERLGEEGVLSHGHALNDVVLYSQAEVARLLHLDMWVQGKEAASYGCDGLILSTPTGSTAHALSAGGPIVMPTLDAIIVAPICAHTLSNRPLVLSSEDIVEVRSSAEGQRLHAVLDGQVSWPFEKEDTLRVTVSDRRFPLLLGSSWEAFTVLKRKLHWRGRMIGDP